MDRMYEQNQMPHNNEAEQSVLGSIIIDPELIITTQEVLLPESFYRCPSTYFPCNDALK